MKDELLSLFFFALGIAAYSISQLQQHGKLRLGVERGYGFWDEWSHTRKYKKTFPEGWVIDAKDNWYTRLFKIKYKERWFTSTNLTVALTDGYHLMQFLFFLFISLSFAPILGLTWSVIFWGVAHIIHWAVYRFLQR